MSQHNAANERIKRQYFEFLTSAKRQSEATVDGAAEAIHRFEAFNRFKDFKLFHAQQAVAFKNHLAEQRALTSGKPLSKATLYATLTHLKRFIQWLAFQPGYRSRMNYTDAEYFNLTEKEARVATARRIRPHPSVAQVLRAIDTMPATTVVQRRDRALLAFTLLTGARDSAIASFKIKHIDVHSRCVFQDARDVDTKFSKTFPTFFFPVDATIEAIVGEWVSELRDRLLYGPDDPLFPSTRVEVNAEGQFATEGLSRDHWKTAGPIRAIFRRAFTAAGLPYFNPHGFRNTLVELAQVRCRTPEQFKAWSQNLGHDGVLTTFTSYGAVSTQRQGELIAGLDGRGSTKRVADFDEMIAALARLRDHAQHG